jgi:rhodanese-related sulfurtransferase
MKENKIIIDVRSEKEYLAWHIADSINIPLEKLEKGIDQIKDKAVKIVVCCASGFRSMMAKNFLNKLGYQNVENGGPCQLLK